MTRTRSVRRLATSAVIGLVLGATALPESARAGGPIGIDHRVTRDVDGPWSHGAQQVAFKGLLVLPWAVALFEGTETRIGRTAWRSAEAATGALAVAAVGKRAFSRKRPDQTEPPDPDAWFQGSPHDSFPSGHVTLAAAVVTPIIIEYAQDQPWTWGLVAVPAWLGAARVKNQAHWQTDVLAGALLGAGMGWATSRLDSPLVLRWLGDGGFVGLRYRF